MEIGQKCVRGGRRFEEINFDILPNLYSVSLKQIRSLDQFEFLLKIAENYPLYSALLYRKQVYAVLINKRKKTC